jgi:squalene-associated FAD-dependent desaturase
MTSAALPVAVIGAGYAGMAAAVELVAAGVPVVVHEAGQDLGGRARGVRHRGLKLDNGLHILVGAYRELLELIARVHGTPPERLLLRLPLTWRIGERVALDGADLPAPWHLLVGFLRARGIAWRDRLAAARFVAARRRTGFRCAAGTTVDALLETCGQSRELRRDLWDPLCLAALNTPPQSASAQVFLDVLRDTLAGAREASDLLLPRCDLGTLFPEAAAAWIEARGAAVRRSHRIQRLDPGAGRVTLGSTQGASAYRHAIVAAAPRAAAALLAGAAPLAALAARIDRFEALPICSVWLQYPRPVRLPVAMLGLEHGPGQWAFDRERLCGQTGLVGVVISGPGSHLEMPAAELAAAVHGQLAAVLPGLSRAPEWSKVVRERHATHACTPELCKPQVATPHPRVWLAGDYTSGPYPATLEAAVRSGRAAATGVLAALRAERIENP